MTEKLESNPVENYFSLMAKTRGDAWVKRLRHQMAFQYKGIDFRGRRVLDIGGGNGVHSFYAAARGAQHVLTIEPELDGSTAGVLALFRNWKNHLAASNVDLEVTTFQDFDPSNRTFDLVIIQDAINHLDEDACVSLDTNPESRERYREIFKKLASVTTPEGYLLFSDCSSVNFYPAMGIRNPFDPGIEWEKHQPPGKWVSMLEEFNFREVSTRWSTPTKMGKFGRLFGNALMTYFYSSHFVVLMQKE